MPVIGGTRGLGDEHWTVHGVLLKGGMGGSTGIPSSLNVTLLSDPDRSIILASRPCADPSYTAEPALESP